VDPDELGGQLEQVLRDAHDALDGEQDGHDADRATVLGLGAAAPEQPPQRDGGHPEQGGEPAVLVDHEVERVRTAEVQAVDDVAGARAAGVGARGGGDRAGEDRDRAQGQERAGGPHRETVRRARALPALVVGAPRQGHAGVEQEHREHVVAHDEARRQMVLDRQRPEPGLREHAEGQERAERREVPAERPPPPGEGARGGDD
jgi:hypothetical protein